MTSMRKTLFPNIIVPDFVQYFSIEPMKIDSARALTWVFTAETQRAQREGREMKTRVKIYDHS